MPLYEYACKKCNKRFEVLQNIGTDSAKCPDCESDCEKLLSSTSFQLKGSGWYKTDYTSSSSASKSSSSCSSCKSSSDGKCGL
ncbi:MAG: zinc ribbon domain-containing protein [bacterium]